MDEETLNCSLEEPPLLRVKNLSVGFSAPCRERFVKALDRVSFSLRRGRTLCLVGESGCGKSITAKSILRLLDAPAVDYLGGEIFFEEIELISLSEKRMAALRGNRLAMIFQEPMTSLNPVLRIGDQVAEPLLLHAGLRRAAAKEQACILLEKTGLCPGTAYYDCYPHELSGGMRQRVMIAMALACSPQLVVADEPTTALDVTIQRQILLLLRDLLHARGASLLLITHDFTVVSRMADDVAVMYAGRIVERGPVQAVLAHAAHPYAQGLLACRPHFSGAFAGKEIWGRKQLLSTIPGMVPSLRALPDGCHFHPRCERRMERCRSVPPPFFPCREKGHFSACWLYAP